MKGAVVISVENDGEKSGTPNVQMTKDLKKKRQKLQTVVSKRKNNNTCKVDKPNENAPFSNSSRRKKKERK